MAFSAEEPGTFWFLEGFVDDQRELWRTVVRTTPFAVGRSSRADLQLNSDAVSARHAEFFEHDGEIWLRDLGSTNGTYVNFERLSGEVRLDEGDVIHFANQEFRLAIYRPLDQSTTREITSLDLTSYLAARSQALLSLIRHASLIPHFQPVLDLESGLVEGYELLSRGEVGGTPAYPEELFFLAERLGLERKLSQVCREKGVEVAGLLDGLPWVFLNTHPAELRDVALLGRSLAELRAANPDRRLVLELHESAVTGARKVSELRNILSDLDIRLAFDDFGKGRSRLLEIAESPPDYLKFDMALIRDLSRESSRWQLLESLVDTASGLGIVPIAEGIETRGELSACRKVGFSMAQGFFLGRPEPLVASAGGETSHTFDGT